MFRKQGVCRNSNRCRNQINLKDIADSLFFWGIARIYQYGIGVAATDWNRVSAKKKAAIDKRATAIAKKIASRNGKINPRLKTKGMFYIMRMMQKNGWNSRDVEYWKAQGWTEKASMEIVGQINDFRN